jgi:hypothetical protein
LSLVGSDWVPFFTPLLPVCHQHALSLRCLHQSSGNGFQRRIFLFPSVPELYPWLSHINSQLTDSQQNSFQTEFLYAIQEGCLGTGRQKTPFAVVASLEPRKNTAPLFVHGFKLESCRDCQAVAVVYKIITQQRLHV